MPGSSGMEGETPAVPRDEGEEGKTFSNEDLAWLLRKLQGTCDGFDSKLDRTVLELRGEIKQVSDDCKKAISALEARVAAAAASAAKETENRFAAIERQMHGWSMSVPPSPPESVVGASPAKSRRMGSAWSPSVASTAGSTSDLAGSTLGSPLNFAPARDVGDERSVVLVGFPCKVSKVLVESWLCGLGVISRDEGSGGLKDGLELLCLPAVL